MKVDKDKMLEAIEYVLRMDKGPVKHLRWDEFKTTIRIHNSLGRCIDEVYTGTMSPVNIMLVVAARASAAKGGR